MFLYPICYIYVAIGYRGGGSPKIYIFLCKALHCGHEKRRVRFTTMPFIVYSNSEKIIGYSEKIIGYSEIFYSL